MNRPGPKCVDGGQYHANVNDKCVRCGLPKIGTYARRVRDFFLCTKRDVNGCLIWTGSQNNCGYGRTGSNAWATRHAHRVAWFIAKKYWPTELDHICHRTLCVDVAHLREVTHLENMRNRINAGKCKRGHLIAGDNKVSSGFWKGRERFRCQKCYDAKKAIPQNCRKCGFRLYGRGKVNVAGSWICRSPKYCAKRQQKALV